MIKKIFARILTYEFTPVILLAVCLISYGVLTPLIGFYLDDWYLIWFKHTFGSLEFINYFKLDRPLEGYFYVVANFILGNSETPLVWQLFGIFTHWLSVTALWQMLNTIWPEAKRPNLQVALLAAVFPGFTQEWIAASYSFHFTCLAGFFFSVTLMLKAIRTPKRFWLYYLLSIAIMAYVIPASEFYIGLELIRLLILFYEFERGENKIFYTVSKTVLFWLPYAITLSSFIVWRTFFFNSVNHSLAIKEMLSGGIRNFIVLTGKQIYKAIVDSVINSWTNPFNLENYPSKGGMTYVILALMIIVFTGLFFWLRKLDKRDNQMDKELGVWRKQAPWLAFISLIFAIIPFWSAGLTIDYHFPFDRFLLAYIFGSCLLIVWIFESTKLNSLKNTLIISLLVTVALGYQVSIANQYKNMWSTQENFYWQFIWRVPNLKEDTSVIAYQLPNFEYWSGNSLTSFLNWTYGNKVVDRKIKYQFILLNSGQKEEIPSLYANLPIKVDFRTFSFEGNTSKSIFVYYSTDGCMRVFDSKNNPPASVMDAMAGTNLNKEDPRILDTFTGAALTDLNLISSDGSHTVTPPLNILGSEPVHDWCYYFEKADLARQNKDYVQIVSLFNQASQKGLSSQNGSEYYPFIDAFAHEGNWQEAMSLTLNWLPTTSPALQNGFCALWQSLGKEFPNETTPPKIIPTLRCQINSN